MATSSSIKKAMTGGIKKLLRAKQLPVPSPLAQRKLLQTLQPTTITTQVIAGEHVIEEDSPDQNHGKREENSEGKEPPIENKFKTIADHIFGMSDHISRIVDHILKTMSDHIYQWV